MTDETPTLREELVPQVVEAIGADELDLAWELVKSARGAARSPEDTGTLAGFEIALEAVADAEAGKETLDDLLATRPSGGVMHGLGCTLSDVGHGLGYEPLLEWADRVFGQGEEDEAGRSFPANRALVLERLGRPQEAVEAYGRALSLDPDWVLIRLRRSEQHRNLGNHDEAAADLVAWLEAHPDDVHQRIWLAIAHSDAGRFDEAQAEYARAAEDEPDNLSLHFNWLITAQRMGDGASVEREAARVAEIDPSDWRADLGRAIALGVKGDHRAAVERARALFDAVAAEEASGDPEEDSEQLSLIASWVVGLARTGEIPDALDPFFERLFDTWIFPRPALDAYRRAQGRGPTVLADFWVGVEAVRDFEGETRAYRVAYRLVAEDLAQAELLAVEFERRCGATRARAAESEEMDPAIDEDYAGVWWRGGILGFFSVQEYEAEDG